MNCRTLSQTPYTRGRSHHHHHHHHQHHQSEWWLWKMGENCTMACSTSSSVGRRTPFLAPVNMIRSRRCEQCAAKWLTGTCTKINKQRELRVIGRCHTYRCCRGIFASVDFDNFSRVAKNCCYCFFKTKIVSILIIYTKYILRLIRWECLLCFYHIFC